MIFYTPVDKVQAPKGQILDPPLLRTSLVRTIVSESDILGPIDDFSDIENLASFERAMFEDYSFKYRIQI